jgi:hypothetical protein
MNDIMQVVNTVFRLEILVETKKREYVEARMLFSKMLRDIGFPYMSIGTFLGKNHATIIHYINKFDIYFKLTYLRHKYELCHKLYFGYPLEKREKEYDKQKELSDYKDFLENRDDYKLYLCEKGKYKRFENIIKMMCDRASPGKEEMLETKIRLFLNSI